MADFCYDCTEELFGAEVAARNDMTRVMGDDEFVLDLCERCGYNYFDMNGCRVSTQPEDYDPEALNGQPNYVYSATDRKWNRVK